MSEFNDKDQLLSGGPPDSSGGAPESASVQPGGGWQEPSASGINSAPVETPSPEAEAVQSPLDSDRQAAPAQTPPPANGMDSGWQEGAPAPNQNQGAYPGGAQGSGYPGTPYSPSYPANSYQPNQYTPYGQGSYHRGGYPPSGGQAPYNPYQYSPNTGWQPPRQDKYEWNFEDYDKLDTRNTKRKRNRGVIVFTISLLVVLTVGIVGLAGYSVFVAANEDGLVDGAEVESSEEADGEDSAQMQIAERPEISETIPVGGKMSIPQVAKSVSPSVVGVIMYANNQYYEVGGLGSGIIMSEDGYIITNAHVVADGTGYKVQLHNGDPYDATLIGYDLMSDLAVLKIEESGLVPAQFGDSDQIEVGETVIAIGNPAGLELAGSVTQGIVSAVNREVRTTNYSMNYIQTDAAINPGNSGGALANEFGQVIGINSSKIVAAGYEGIGFAIPITSAKPIIDDLISNGKVTGRVMLGITCRAVDEVDARNYGIERGLSIDSIDPSSDLSKAGVLKGDILTHIDGERVLNLSDVKKILDQHEVDDEVKLTLYRRLGAKEITYEVTTRLLEGD